MEVSFVLPTTLVIGYAVACLLAVILGWLIARNFMVARTLLRMQDLLDLHADAIHSINEQVTALTPKKKAPAKKKAPVKRAKAAPAEKPATPLSKGLASMSFADDSSPTVEDDGMFDNPRN